MNATPECRRSTTPINRGLPDRYCTRLTALYVVLFDLLMLVKVYGRWHDLAAIARSPYFTTAIADREVAIAVAHHNSYFFIESYY